MSEFCTHSLEICGAARVEEAPSRASRVVEVIVNLMFELNEVKEDELEEEEID